MDSKLRRKIEFHRRLKALGFKSYSEYLRSDHWIAFRTAYFASGRERRHRCAICRKKRRLELHHTTYARLGAERPQDVRPLCDPCHRDLHEQEKRGDVSLRVTFPRA